MATAQTWPNRHGGLYATVAYQPQNRLLAKLPGQDAYAEFSDEGRRLYAELIVHGLGTWLPNALETRFVRGRDGSGTAWPTPLAAFLRHAPWIPQALDHQGRSTFAPVSAAWWWSERAAARLPLRCVRRASADGDRQNAGTARPAGRTPLD
ncbi:hypothetical protein ACFQ0M_07905 [Kitasatospora aburaviensis]